MANYKSIIIGLAITILFSVFVFSLVYAIHEKPDYGDFCKNRVTAPKILDRESCPDYTVPADDEEACWSQEGFIEYEEDSNGCTIGHSCNTCTKDYNEKMKGFNFLIFIYAAIFGLVAIIGGLYFPINKNKVNDTVSTGFMFGGLLTLFIGTVIYFGDADRILRPIIIFIELAIVILVAYKKLRTDKNGKTFGGNTKKD